MIGPLPASRRAALVGMGPDEPPGLHICPHVDGWAAMLDPVRPDEIESAGMPTTPISPNV